MGRAGDYGQRLRWLQAEPVLNTINGQTEYEHHPNGYLWCAVEETYGQRQDEHGAPQHGAQATVRIRQYPAVNELDLLQDEVQGYVWRIDSMYNGDNEIICDCWRNYVVDYVIVGS